LQYIKDWTIEKCSERYNGSPKTQKKSNPRN